MNRRDFLKQGLIVSGMPLFGGLTSSLWSQLAMAKSAQLPNIVVIRMFQGLDGVQGIHPWLGQEPDPKQLFLAYRPSELIRTDTEIVLAPSAAALAPYASKMAIVRGVFMGPNDLGHPFAQQYISSGRSQAKAPHFSAMIASRRFRSSDPLVVNAGVEAGNYNYLTLPTVKLKNFELMSGGGKFLSNLQLDMVQSYQDFASRRELIEEYHKALQSVLALRSEALKALPDIPSDALDEETVAAALASGVSSMAQIDFTDSIGGSADSHARYKNDEYASKGSVDHPSAQKARWDRLANFLNLLDQLKVLDRTLVVAVTEFSRTAALNMNAGKDHNYFNNSMLMAGWGVNGGRAIGSQNLHETTATGGDSIITASHIDFKTGESIRFKKLRPSDYNTFAPGPGVSLIRPKDVLRTMQEIVLPGSVSQYGDDAQIIPGIVSSRS